MKFSSLSKFILTVILFAILFILSPYHVNTNKYNSVDNEEFCKAMVKKVTKSETSESQKVVVLVKKGNYKNQEFIVDNNLTTGNKLLYLKPNDEVLLLIEDTDKVKPNVIIYQYIREKKILYLALFFVILVMIIGGIKGINALVSVAFTICVICILLLPGILKGNDPIKLTIFCCIIIAVFSLIIQNGVSKKTLASLMGTLGGVTVAGVVTIIMSKTLNVSVNAESCMQLLKIPQKINFNFNSILFSSILIGSLGANIDMSMSVASAMSEIKESNKNISRDKLISSGMNIGRDVIGTMCNTLILAYVGSALVSLLLFMAYNINLNYIINLEDISIEILRSLAGSIGIVLSVPLTVFAKAFMD